MVQPYKMGRCPVCGDKIMVRDSTGVLNAFRGNHRQIDLVFGNGQKVRTAICSICLENGFNKEELIDTITHEDSQACDSRVSNYIKNLGEVTDYYLSEKQATRKDTLKQGRTADTARTELDPQ